MTCWTVNKDLLCLFINMRCFYIAEQMQCWLCLHKYDWACPDSSFLSGRIMGFLDFLYLWDLSCLLNWSVNKMMSFLFRACRHSMERNGKSSIVKRLLHWRMLGYRASLHSLHTSKIRAWWMKIRDVVLSSSTLMVLMLGIRYCTHLWLYSRVVAMNMSFIRLWARNMQIY